MSLLHKALKKAEREREGRIDPTTGALIDEEPPSEGGPRWRLYFFVSLLVVSLVLVVTLRLWKGGKRGVPVIAQKGELSQTPLGIGAHADVNEMKRQVEGLLQDKKWEGAKDLLEKLVILEPEDAELYNNLGAVLKQKGEYDGALEQYQKALSLKPDFAEALNNQGVLHLARRELKEASESFEKAVNANPSYAAPHFHLGLLGEAAGKGEEAKKEFEEYLRLAKGIDADFLLKLQQRIDRLETP